MASMYFSRCYSAHDRRLGRLFGRYGRLVARYPWCIMIISILSNLILGIGIFYMEFETDIEVQYFLQDSRAFQDRTFLRNSFTNSKNNYQIFSLADYGYFGEVIIRSKKNGNVFEKPVFNEILNINKYIRERVVVTDENNITRKYEDLCARFHHRCVVFGNEILVPSFPWRIKSKNVTYPLYNNSLLSSLVGKPTVKQGILVSAEMVKLRYYLAEDSKTNYSLSMIWVRKFIQIMEELVTNKTDFAFSYYNALDDEVARSAMAEAHLFPLTLIMMIVYASFATAGKKVDCIYGRQNLGRVGVFCALLSIVPAMGVASALGVKFMNSVATMPFLIIGIGINDMFIIMSGHADTIDKDDLSLDERMKRTMMTSGLAITVTSLTDVITYMIGYTSLFSTIKNFCVYTGLAVLFCYMNQLTILAPCIVLQQKRTDQNKHSYTCKVMKSKEQLRQEGRSVCYVVCCSGEKPTTREELEGIMETYPKRLVQFLVKNNISRILILIFYLAYLVLSTWGILGLKQSTKFSDLALAGSHYYKASTWDYNNFPLELPVQLIITSPLDYTNKEILSSIENLTESVRSYSLVSNNTEINWLSAFKHFSGNQFNTNNFYNTLQHFLNATTIFKDDVVWDSKHRNSIKASRFHFFTTNIRTSELQAKFLLELRKVIAASGLPCTVYTPLFVFFEQYANMISSTLQTVGVAVSAMFIITCFFMPNPTIIVFVTVSMISILLGVFGFLKFWGLDISAVTMVELVISVGFSVDFSTHICHAYLTSPSRDKKVRVKEALELAGGPIINGALSTIVGLTMLVFSKSFIFQSFFKVLFMVVVFGLLHAVLIIPIILSFFGPKVRLLPNQKNDLVAIQSKQYSEKESAQTKPLFPIQNGNGHCVFDKSCN